MKKYTLILFLLFSSCEIEEVARQPLLATPLGLQVKTAPAVGGGTGLVLFFYANNPEIYFSGFSIYVSTRKSDFSYIGGDAYWPINPMDVPGSQASLLTNYTSSTDTNITIYVGGEMAFPERRTYPEVVGWDTSTSDTTSPEFTWTSFSTLPPTSTGGNGGNFVSGTEYYFAVYSYSSLDNEYSLPSNIESIVFP